MVTTKQVKQVTNAAGYEYVEPRLSDGFPFVVVGGLPRVDVKTLIEQARRRQAGDALIISTSDDQ
jgi:hypothetical protein